MDQPTTNTFTEVEPDIFKVGFESQNTTGTPEIANETRTLDANRKSWVFRFFGAFCILAAHLFGIASIIFLVAVSANIPIIQFLGFGYLLEVSGRLARGQKFRDAMIGLNKAKVIGGIILGTWLTLWPIRLVSQLWLEAYLIDPASTQTSVFRVLQIVAIGLALIHIATAWMSGGKLRYFFWPIIAPISFGIWIFKKTAGIKIFRSVLNLFLGWISPTLVDDICNVKPISDWFPPAILRRRLKEGNVYAFARDRVWDFTSSLNLGYYFKLGFKGFVGTFFWLLIPTGLLVAASFAEGGASIACGVLGTLIAIPTFAILPYVQTHFAKDGKLKRFLEVRAVLKNLGRAPLAHLVGLLLILVLGIPLFLLKIERIPNELLWTLSVAFVLFSWPARLIAGWAYRRGTKRERSFRWWVRYPIAAMAFTVSFSFILILTLTRYISWSGARSLYENHVFLLPAPFWL
jgi:hypothetical protein